MTSVKTHRKRYYITTPIYYVTAKPHLGSLYSTVLADIAARWHRLKGQEVFFLTGTDEHGQKIANAAALAGQDPQSFVDGFIPAYKDIWNKYHIEYQHFVRTTDPEHKHAVQTWIEQAKAAGDIYKGFYKGWYCVPCETFVSEREEDVVQNTTGPHCPTCARPTIPVEEETYFFKLSAYQDKLLTFYKEHPEFINPPERAQEVINFVKAGLKDLSISRTTLSWGIPFPGDPKHVTYVWADALMNYVSAIGYSQPGREQDFRSWWPADVHVMGKDIVRFHAIYWPAFLMSVGIVPPSKLLVHGWIQVNKEKMSKSRGNVIDPLDLYNTYGAEAIRYYLTRYIAITQDGEFNITDLEQKLNSDLANDLGNLLNRMSVLAHKYAAYMLDPITVWSSSSLELRNECSNVQREMNMYMDEYMFHLAYSRLWRFIGKVNSYFHENEPWKIAATNPEKLKEILSATAHSLYTIALLAWPIMPAKMVQLLESLGQLWEPNNNAFKEIEVNVWNKSFIIKKIDTLFPKYESTPMVKPASNQTEQASVQDYITIDQFSQIELLVGTIISAETVAQSEKLLKLQVDFGSKGIRQILSGIRMYYSPEEVQGKQGVFVYNLKPRTMLGLESQGMMLFTKDEHNKLQLVLPAVRVPNGTRLQ